VPWHHVARLLGRPPVLSYASYALDNWRRIDTETSIELGNIVLLQNFLGGQDEEWFVLIHVAIEAQAAPALNAILEAQHSVSREDSQELERQLEIIAACMESVHAILLRMPERCDPYIYYDRVRPYLHGWSNHPALPNGLIYEGVGAYSGQPQKFRGETGAQSSLVPSLDAAFNITHQEDFLRTYLREMRDYMPPAHRTFIETIEQGPSIRQYVIERKLTRPAARDLYNRCIDWLERFRSLHLEYAQNYIQKQSERDVNNPADVGTGGTPFIPYLTKHRDETKSHRIV
jgi:indoleamine 2,3-dioxygenase